MISNYIYLNIQLTQCINRQKTWNCQQLNNLIIRKKALPVSFVHFPWTQLDFKEQIGTDAELYLTHAPRPPHPDPLLSLKPCYLLFNAISNHGDRICQTDLCLDPYLKSELFSQACIPV